jgi:TRAP-type C4-dicarboxylate transport system permease small subunit
MDWLIKTEQALTRLLVGILAISFLCIVILIITLVILRYGFNTTIIGANEFVVILFIYTSALGAAIVLGKKEHIAITYFIDKLSPSVRNVVDTINYLLIAFLNIVMIWYSINWIDVTGSYLTAVLQIKQVYAQLIVPLGCGVAIFYCFYHIILIYYPRRTERLQ